MIIDNENAIVQIVRPTLTNVFVGILISYLFWNFDELVLVK